jgi:hypothetical protein
LNGAELANLTVTLRSAGEVDGRKAWHVDLDAEVIANGDDVEGHGAPVRGGHCKNCF